MSEQSSSYEKKPENERIRNTIVGMYKNIVAEVDPKNVLDLLIQKRIINIEFKEELMAKVTRQDRCRALLDHLLICSNDESFIVLREALEEHYHWIVERIDASDEAGKKSTTEIPKTDESATVTKTKSYSHERLGDWFPKPFIEAGINNESDRKDIINTFPFPECKMHSQRPLDFYCCDCKTVVCISCFAENHKLHEYKDVASIDKDFRCRLEEHCAKMQSYSEQMLSKKMDVERQMRDFLKKTSETENAIKSKSQQLKSLIDQHTQSVLDELLCLKQKHQTKMETEIEEIERKLTAARSFMTNCTELNSKGSPIEVCHSADSLITKAKELCKENEECLSAPSKSVEIEFSATDQTALLQNVSNVIGKLSEQNLLQKTLEIQSEENERIRNRVVEMYEDFVTKVDPMDVLDLLIQKHVINIEFKDELMAKKTEDRCRALLDHLLESSNDESFIVFRKALEEGYSYIVQRIDVCDESGGICNTASAKFLKKLKLPAFSSTTYICGITKLLNKIYILCNDPKYVVVFNDRMPFEYLDTIRIEEVKDPYDIASSRKSECLYIVDDGLKTIWEKKTTDDSLLTKWSDELRNPETLFISNDDRLLVLDRSDTSNYLVIFELNGKLVQRLLLPVEIIEPLHCIENPNVRFIISEPFKISELSSDGKDIIRQYHPNDESEKLNWPRYVSLDYDNDLLFVADYWNNRVVLIDSVSHQLKDVIITELCKPYRLLYDSNKNQLIVGLFHGGVNAYKFNKTTN